MKVRGVKKVRQQAQQTKRMRASPSDPASAVACLLPVAAAALRGDALAGAACNCIRLEMLCAVCCA